ncbi:MAG: beta-propeller domain-containing protein [Pseudomonadota bacterium]
MPLRRPALVRLTLTTAGLLALSVNCTRPETLHKFEDCEEMQTYLHDQILHPQVATQVSSGGFFFFGCAQADMAPPSAGEERTEASTTSDVGSNKVYTTTNTQEVNVDEADFVKNDGDHIFVLRRGHLVILDAWPAEQTHVVSDILVDSQPGSSTFLGSPFTMFFDDNYLLVVAADFTGGWQSVREGDTSAPWTGGTVLSLFDVRDRGAPALARRVRIDGSFVDARRVGEQVILVTSSQLAWPGLDSGPFSDDVNRERLATVGLDAILPGLEDQIVGVDATPRRERACTCDTTYAPEATDGRSLMLVHTMSIRDPQAAIASTTVVSAWSQIYASEKSVYLAATEWNDSGFFTPDFAQTRIHKFEAFKDGQAATYAATGLIEGEIHNQFSMDEEGEHFRVVVTSDRDGLTSSLLVLGQEGDSLVERGRVDDIGRGEFVQAVRFFADVAYVVTYPGQTFSAWVPPLPPGGFFDPLWAIDLSDAENPRIRGELQVDGYSTYIHPLDEDHLLTIGIDTDSNNRILGLSLSIFDVADLDHPSLKHRHRFGDGFSWSEAITDHHAFNYFPAHKALGIPVQLTQFDSMNGWWGLSSTGLEVFRVDAEQGFTELGRVEQRDLFDDSSLDQWTSSCIDVRRSVMIADDNGAYVYAVSTGGVSVAEIVPGLPEVARVPFLSAGDPLCPDTNLPL